MFYYSMKSKEITQGQGHTTSSTHLQCLTDSYLSNSVIRVGPKIIKKLFIILYNLFVNYKINSNYIY